MSIQSFNSSSGSFSRIPSSSLGSLSRSFCDSIVEDTSSPLTIEEIENRFIQIILECDVDYLWTYYRKYQDILQPKKSIFQRVRQMFPKKQTIRFKGENFIGVAVRANKPHMIKELTLMGFYSDKNLVGHFLEKYENRTITDEEKKTYNMLSEVGYMNVKNEKHLKQQRENVRKFISKTLKREEKARKYMSKKLKKINRSSPVGSKRLRRRLMNPDL